ncbi:13368_t:CDS:2, partial [Acaulospora colombiana]
ALVLVDTIYSIHVRGHAMALSFWWVDRGDEEKEDTGSGESFAHMMISWNVDSTGLLLPSTTAKAAKNALQHKEASRQTYNKTSNPIKYCVCRQREAPNELLSLSGESMALHVLLVWKPLDEFVGPPRSLDAYPTCDNMFQLLYMPPMRIGKGLDEPQRARVGSLSGVDSTIVVDSLTKEGEACQ